MGHCSGCVAPLGTHGLPVQGRWGLHRRWRGAAVGQRLRVGMRGESIRPHHPRVGTRHGRSNRWRKSATRQRHPLPEGAPEVKVTRAIPGHQARVLEGTTPQGAGQIRYDAPRADSAPCSACHLVVVG